MTCACARVIFMTCARLVVPARVIFIEGGHRAPAPRRDRGVAQPLRQGRKERDRALRARQVAAAGAAVRPEADGRAVRPEEHGVDSDAKSSKK